MKSLLTAIPFVFGTRDSGGCIGRALGCAGLGFVVCLAVPLTSAYAQEFTGIVTCVETYHEINNDDGTFDVFSIENDYTVALDYPPSVNGSMIIDRWGDGRDVVFIDVVSLKRTDVFLSWPLDEIYSKDWYSNQMVNFWTIPESRYNLGIGECGSQQVCLEPEEVYSETGTLKFKVRKDQVNIRGTSYVVMDFDFEGNSEWTTMAAQCTWELSALLPQ